MNKPLPNSIVALTDMLADWRQDFHANPELGFEETRTAARVAERLRDFGVDAVETGIGKTGVVGVLHGADGPGGPTIMLRADMDALPIDEATGAPHASRTPGVMHACGHDGHTTMLLGAAKHLAETRAFSGTVYFCFQPAEEGQAGAAAMLADGLFERFRPRAVYGMHNLPGLPVGHMAVTPGPVMAAADGFTITLVGRGGHGAMPHITRDTLLAGAWLVTQLQSVVSRRVNPLQPAVVSITEFKSGFTHNVIPDTALLRGTTRSFDPEVDRLIWDEIRRLVEHVCTAHGCTGTVERDPNPYPPTLNDPDEARFAHSVMVDVLGPDAATFGHEPSMAGEDFAFLAQEVPGAYVILGNGDSAPLHNPAYDFDDSASAVGVAYWCRLVETALPRR